MAKVIITGGCGFIGSCLVRKLLNETDLEVVNVDKLTYASTEQSLWSVDKSKRYSFYQADICDESEMEMIFEKERPDAVFHLAAESHVDRSIKGPAEFMQTNIFGTYNLVQTARAYLEKHKPSGFKFIHVSTDEVYGSLALDGKEKFHETYPYQPNSPYSASKASSDFIVRSWTHTFGFPGIITHCSNNYGPYQLPEKLIPKTIINFTQRKNVPVYGDGKNVRDWIHVEDHCDALFAVLERGRIGETYDIGGDAERQNIDIVEKICKLVERWHSITESSVYSITEPTITKSLDQYITFVADRLGHDHRYAIDSSKIKKELSWAPRIPFEQGLSETVSWYFKNRKWWSQHVKGEAYAV